MAVAQLQYIISLTDRMTKPMGNVTKAVDKFTQKTKANMKSIAMGAAGLFAVGKSLQAAFKPAVEMDRALGELASLDVADSALKKLTKTAIQFSNEYGKSAVNVVKSAYSIRKAFGALSDNELSGLTYTTNLLSTATNESIEDATNYMARMYALYKNQANAIGKVKWAEQIAAQSAEASKLFKTNLSELETVMKTVAPLGQAKGMDVSDLFAVAGQLSDKITSGKAGKQFEAFLMGLDKAQQAMGMSFKDSNGKLLSTDKILNLIKKRFGDLQRNKDAIAKAFGGEAAYKFILNLAGETELLNKNIHKLGQAGGLQALSKQAHKMTDPWQRLEALIFNISAAIGSTLQPKLYPILNNVIDIGQAFNDWLVSYPNIARWIGYIISLLMSFAAVGPVMMTLKGIFGLWWGSMKGAFKLILALSKAIKLNMFISKSWAIVMWTLNVVFKAVRIAAMLMWSSISLPILAIIAAIALIGYVVYQNWEKIKAFGGKLWESLLAGWQNLTQWIKDLWQSAVEFFQEFSPLSALDQFAELIKNSFNEAIKWIKNKLISFINWYIEKANKITSLIGIEIPKIKLEDTETAIKQTAQITQVMPTIEQGRPLANPTPHSFQIAPAISPIKAETPNFSSQHFKTTQNIDRSLTFTGDIHIQAQDPKQFEQMLRDQQQLR